MFVAAGQFIVSPVWENNVQVCVSLMSQAADRGGPRRIASGAA